MNRILIVLPNWYGEALFATPFLRGLRAHVPGAFIATLSWPQCHEILVHNPSVNELIAFDERGAHRSLIGKWRLIRQLAALHFDAAFILRRSTTRSLMVWLTGVPTRIGWDSAKNGWLLTQRVPPPSVPMHKAASYLPLLRAIGASARADGFDYVVTEDERRAAGELLRSRGVTAEHPLIVLHPGANWFHKRWPTERFAALGDRLIDTHRAQVLVTGGPADATLAETVRTSMQGPGTVLAGATTLRELAACLERASLVISNDTGVLHLAAALRRPLVGLYGPTAPALTGPLGDSSRIRILHHPDCCPAIPCLHPETPRHAGMAAITVDEAYAASISLLGRTP